MLCTHYEEVTQEIKNVRTYKLTISETESHNKIFKIAYTLYDLLIKLSII